MMGIYGRWICIQNYEISNRLKIKYLFLEECVPLKRAFEELSSVFLMSSNKALEQRLVLKSLGPRLWMVLVDVTPDLLYAGLDCRLQAFHQWDRVADDVVA